MIQVEHLSVIYQKEKTEHIGIRDMNLTLLPGELLAVVGRSGCGKTTFLNALAGVCPYQGQIILDGCPLTPKTMRIGLIPQDYGLLPWKTVRNNCLFGVEKKAGKDAAGQVDALLERLGIRQVQNHYPHEISGGQAQRTALARALLMQPRLLLMDEAFAALDEASAREAMMLTLAIWREQPTESYGVVITHRLEEAFFLADRILVMGAGGAIRGLFQNQWQGQFDIGDEDYIQCRKRIQSLIREEAETTEAGKEREIEREVGT